MTPERLRALLDAYGADAARWPAAEREAARALLTANPGQWQEQLAGAVELDDWLRLEPLPAPSAALRSAIERSAPAKDAPRYPSRWWLPSLGLAGAGAAGVAAGVLAMSLLVGLDSAPGATTSLEAYDQPSLTNGINDTSEIGNPASSRADAVGPLSALAYATTGFDDAGLPGDKQ